LKKAKSFFYKKLNILYNSSPFISYSKRDKFVIFSDLHIGNKGYKDDFLKNSELFCYVCKEIYYKNNFTLILNGDIEELYKFSLKKIHLAWNEVFKLFNCFKKRKAFFRIIGNHDYMLKFIYSNNELYDGIKLKYKDNVIFILHGHQVDSFFKRYHGVFRFFFKYIFSFLYIKNFEVHPNNRKKYKLEKRVYDFAKDKRIVAIVGHTHRPLFETLSKIDFLRFKIEQLCREYVTSTSKKRHVLQKLVEKYKQELNYYVNKSNVKNTYQTSLYSPIYNIPCLFNSGCVIGKGGITAIEIEDGYIRLVHYFDKNKKRKYFKYANVKIEKINKSNFCRVVLNENKLDYVFTRIKLLS